jgi:hypothetical protein
VISREEKLRCCLFGLIFNWMVRSFVVLQEGPSRVTIVQLLVSKCHRFHMARRRAPNN